MIRKMLGHIPVGAICACLVLMAGRSWALGLGEIELNSALNEKLNAEIELLDASGLQPSEILVSLASNEDFERVGVERFFFLTDLEFEVARGSGGNAVVEISSSQPITEPYLNFLVEVLWPNGRLLKEFTLLLDPPTFSEASTPEVAAPTRSEPPTQTAGRIERGSETSTGTQVQTTPNRRPPARSPLDDEFMTDRNDTLWAIAARHRPAADISVQQHMLAIQRLNPEAFIRENINLLKAGYRLTMPTEEQARALTFDQAVGIVATQNEQWRAYKRGEVGGAQQIATNQSDSAPSALQGQLDATDQQQRQSASSAGASGGELRILAGEGDSAAGTTTEPGAEVLNAALEEQDRLSREVDELTYQLDREQELAQSQLEVKDRQIDVKDQQIAQLQAQLAEMREELERREQIQNESTSAIAPESSWWQSPYVLGGAAGVLVLALVGGLVVARRNREQEEGFYPEPQFLAEHDEDADAMADEFAGASHEDDDARSEAVDDDEPGGVESSDVVGEADIYAAYGRYSQAITLLTGVLDDDPGRDDARLKLLECYAATGEREAFDDHHDELRNRSNDADLLAAADQLEAQFAASAADEGPDEGPDEDHHGGDVAEAESAVAEDEDLSLDELGIGDDSVSTFGSEESEHVADDTLADTVEQEAAAPSQPEEDSTISFGDADFELELDGVDETDTDEDAAGGAGDQLGGDLGIDFDPDRAESPDDELLSDVSAPGLDDRPAAATATAAQTLEDSDVATLDDDDFDFDDEAESANTKLDLARAYIDMGDEDGARDILDEVVIEGNAEQQQQARSMLESL